MGTVLVLGNKLMTAAKSLYSEKHSLEIELQTFIFLLVKKFPTYTFLCFNLLSKITVSQINVERSQARTFIPWYGIF